jgi:hypothetical protein
MGLEPGESAGFVLTRAVALSNDIGGEDGREPTFDPLCAQRFLPRRAILFCSPGAIESTDTPAVRRSATARQ